MNVNRYEIVIKKGLLKNNEMTDINFILVAH